ncbi:MAG: hypothetical protein IPM81_06185 [Saprospirales bacterium]|nr:hypothetical protein [Saprospirales bacterium]
MKKIFILIMVGLAGWAQLSAQCICDFKVELVQVPNDPCCFDVLFCNNGGPACNLALTYSPLIISTNGNPNATAPIASATSANTSIVTATLQGSYQAVFSSNFAALAIGCNPKFNLGRICLANAPNAQVQFSATINQPGGPCALPIAVSQFMVPTCTTPAVLLEKVYGDGADNRPTATKAFGDGIYVSGYRVVGGVEYGTFSKFDLNTGALVFERELTTPSRLVDFEYDPNADEFLLVGWTWPLSTTVNNRSVLLKIDDSGNWVFSKYYDQDGREGFNRIVRHPSPLNPAYPYYILGRKNPASAAPSSNDVVVLYNVGASGTRNWSVEYAYSSNPTDDEFSLGLFPYGGDLIMTGLITNNDGALLVIDGANGSVLNSVRYPQSMDIHDGIPLWSNLIALVGENFAAHEAFVMVISPFGPAPFSTAPGNPASLQFPNITNFKDIWVDQYGKLYVIGENKNPALGKNYQVVHKLNYFFHGGGSILSVDWARYLEDFTETSFANGVISVTPSHDRIFYADTRLRNTSFFGSWDMLVGAYDLDLNAACRFDFPFPTTPLILTASPISVSNANFNEPSFISPQVQPIKGCCTNFCSSPPCTADFTCTPGDCFKVTFTATSSSCFQGTYTYEWDFDGNGTIDATTNNPTISYQFPCGGGGFNVCVTVTDPMGCVATICKPVIVNNCVNCIKLISSSLKCNPNDFDAYDFTITVQDMTPSSFCSYNLINLPPGWALSNFAESGFPLTTLTGTIHVTCTTPAALNLTVQANCICLVGGSFTCTLPVSIPTICCKSIEVPPVTACEDDKVLDVSIQPFGTLCNITQVSWFVRPKPATGICPTTPWGGLPYQQTNMPNVLEPLHLFPASMSGDVCVYAVVQLNDGPCTMLTSNIACIQLCAPTTCTLLNDQNYCYTGSCITPAPLTLALNAPSNACFPSIQWYDPFGNGVQQGPAPTYTPTQCLSMANPLTDCYEDFYYTVRIADFCGVRECKARIRLYSDDAPKGTLEVKPFEANTLCPYEDITLHFTPGCDSFDLADPPTWDWYTRPCDPALGGGTLLPNAGTMNPNWNTNILQTSAYYYVETKNGVCPADTVQVLLEVKDPLTITAFTATSDPCAEQQVMLDVQWAPCTVAGCPPGTPCTPCSYTVDWFKDCMYIGTTNEPPGSTMSSFIYATLPLAGNYYAVVKDDCCPNNTDTSLVATIDPACFPVIEGPCFRCENETVMLTATAVIPPTMTCPHNCAFSWSTTNGVIVGPTNVPIITANAAGTYTVTITCFINGGFCTKTTSYTLIQCQRAVSGGPDCGVVSVEELLPPEVSPVRVFPNPTTGGVTVEWMAGAPKNGRLFLTDATGRSIHVADIPDGVISMPVEMEYLQPGVYFIKILAADRLFEVAKVVKQ